MQLPPPDPLQPAYQLLRPKTLLPASPFAALLVAMLSAASGVEIPAAQVPVTIAGQPISVGIAGHISDTGELTLRADLGDFQAHLTPLLKAELDRSERCGERISVEDATLLPAAPGALLTAHLHVEKWVCIKAFGKENAKRLVAGNAVIEMKITPRADDDNTLRLDAGIGKIDADGSLGELLHSGSLGDSLRDKIRESILKAVRKATDLDALIPAKARDFATLRALSFEGAARLELRLQAQLREPK